MFKLKFKKDEGVFNDTFTWPNFKSGLFFYSFVAFPHLLAITRKPDHATFLPNAICKLVALQCRMRQITTRYLVWFTCCQVELYSAPWEWCQVELYSDQWEWCPKEKFLNRPIFQWASLTGMPSKMHQAQVTVKIKIKPQGQTKLRKLAWNFIITSLKITGEAINR